MKIIDALKNIEVSYIDTEPTIPLYASGEGDDMFFHNLKELLTEDEWNSINEEEFSEESLAFLIDDIINSAWLVGHDITLPVDDTIDLWDYEKEYVVRLIDLDFEVKTTTDINLKH